MYIIVNTEDGRKEVNLDEVGVEDVNKLIMEISVELDLPEDAKTLLYSGYMRELELTTLEIVKEVEGVRLIRNTELAHFLQSNDFEMIIEAAVSNDLKKAFLISI